MTEPLDLNRLAALRLGEYRVGHHPYLRLLPGEFVQLLALARRAKAMETALMWYADSRNYRPHPERDAYVSNAHTDGGERARAALAQRLAAAGEASGG